MSTPADDGQEISGPAVGLWVEYLKVEISTGRDGRICTSELELVINWARISFALSLAIST